MHVVIVANAPVAEVLPLLPLLQGADLLIAADGGANTLHRAGVAPHLLLGDLDSVEAEVLASLEAQGREILRFSREKDETDLELALVQATERGASQIDVLGALGGRLDHTLANITMLEMPALAGRGVRLLDAEQEVFLVQAGQPRTLHGQQGDTVSLLPLSGKASGITLAGFYYPLQAATLVATRARGLSNILLDSSGSIVLEQGTLLVVHHFDQGAYQWAFYQQSQNEPQPQP